MVSHPDRADLERRLSRNARWYDTRANALEAMRRQRDELIREAIRAGIPRRRIAELAGISVDRVYQIRRD